MSKPVINIADIELQPRPAAYAATGAAAERYDARAAMIGMAIGARKLGYNITAIPPGKRAFPFHSHVANEEMVFVLEGHGEVRIGTETWPIRQGDFVRLLSGGPETAHQVINSGDTELKYLAVSTRIYPEVCEYPDSGKFGLMAEYPGEVGKPKAFRFIGKTEQNLDYWEGE